MRSNTKNIRGWAAIAAVLALLAAMALLAPGAGVPCLAYGTVFSLLPPVLAIALALATKEVYSSLMLGIAAGALLYVNGSPLAALNTLLFDPEGGMVSQLCASGNVGILVFLVLLGILVSLINHAGGSAAFGRWASRRIHGPASAQLCTTLLGVLIFIDDYFNCLTVGSVMRPVTDRQRVSRAKLAYLIDATAAPVCIIAPVSSWAAAVTSSVPPSAGINGFTMFLRTIPYNYYAFLTLGMLLFLTFTGADFGPMKRHEDNARLHGDLYTTAARPYGEESDAPAGQQGGSLADLLLPIAVLIAACITGMVYTGGLFEGASFIDAFANCDAPRGLVLGAAFTLAFTLLFTIARGSLSFAQAAACVPEGFQAMIAPMLILTMAWTLSGVTGLLGAKYFVAGIVQSATAFTFLLPAIVFTVAAGLAFATGTSWGTFAILIPIVCSAFPSGEMLVVTIAACLAGAVCGDHCSPISDTTIMASAGAQCDHVNHVSTQLPYALTAAALCVVCYLAAGLMGGAGGALGSVGLLAAALAFEQAVLLAVRRALRRKAAQGQAPAQARHQP